MAKKNLSRSNNAEENVLSEELWNSASKEDLKVSDNVKRELDNRIQNLEEGKTELHTWEEVKVHLRSIR